MSVTDHRPAAHATPRTPLHLVPAITAVPPDRPAGRVRVTPVPVAEPHPLITPPRAHRRAPGQDELPLRPAAPALRTAPATRPTAPEAPGPAVGRSPAAPPRTDHPAAVLTAPDDRARPAPVRSLPGVRRAPREADFWLPRPTSAAELPDPEQLCATLARAVVEVHAGVRPASQLLRWFTADLYAGLQRRAALGARIRRDRSPARRVAVRRVAVCEPRDGVVEASVVLQDHERVRALALRLEGWDGRWRVTQLDVG